MRTLKTTALALAVTVAGIGTAVAQDEVARVALYTDWSVFNPTEPAEECFIASAPTATVAKRPSGQTYKANRGDIRFYIANRPAEGTVHEVAYTGGYAYKDGTVVTISIGGAVFELFTEGEYAWPPSPEEDAKLIAAMKRGAQATVTGISSRGNTTIDTISLIGFTDALADADTRCEVQ